MAGQRTTLDPKNDAVFKIMFRRQRNKRLLISLLSSILKPPSPITDLEILNPEIENDMIGKKGAVLDLRVRLTGGQQIDLEMQMHRHAGFVSRGLFYWADLYVSQLEQGQAYHLLKPTIGILILNFDMLKAERYHSRFEVLEVNDQEKLTDDLEIHVLELKKLPPSEPVAADPAVLRWMKFFAANSDEELEQVAMTDPDINEAKSALEEVSKDPVARRLARERELADWNYKREMHLSREEGKAEGKAEGQAEGEAKGRAEGLRDAVLHLCRIFQISLTDQRQTLISRATPAELEELHDSIAQHRRWPDS